MTKHEVNVTGRHRTSRSPGAIAAHLPEVGLVLAAALAAVAIIYLSRRLTFFNDEWTYLLNRPTTLLDLLRPYNEHWISGLYLVYGALLAAFGGHSYLPFMAALVAAHLATAVGLFAIAKPRVGGWAALALAVLLLFLGSGAEDLFWAWQVGFVGSCAFGVWALVALDRRHSIGAAFLLIGAVAITGVGLFFVAASGGYLLADSRRRDLIWLVIPVGVYLAWFALFGRFAVADLRDPFTVTAATQLPAYFVLGLSASVGAVFGLPIVGPIVAFVALLVLARQGHVSPMLAAGATGLVAEFTLIGLVRAQLGYYDSSRYVYPAATFILMAGSDVLASMTRSTIRILAAGLIGVAITVNAIQLLQGWPSRWPGREQLTADYGCITAETILMPTGYGTVPVTTAAVNDVA